MSLNRRQFLRSAAIAGAAAAGKAAALNSERFLKNERRWVLPVCCAGGVAFMLFSFGGGAANRKFKRSGRGTKAAKRCMNSSGYILMCVVPSRNGFFSW